MFFIPFDRSQVSTPYGAVRLLLKLRFCVEFFDFRISAYSELTLFCEGSWDLLPLRGSKAEYFSIGLT
jgi:hypothetical protein